MRTNSKLVRDAIKLHIIDCVYDFDGNQFGNLVDAAKHLSAEFDKTANFPANVRRYPNTQQRFMDYLQGLPFHFLYSGGGIEEYLAEIGCVANPKYSDDLNREKAEVLYYYLVYDEMVKAIN